MANRWSFLVAESENVALCEANMTCLLWPAVAGVRSLFLDKISLLICPMSHTHHLLIVRFSQSEPVATWYPGSPHLTQVGPTWTRWHGSASSWLPSQLGEVPQRCLISCWWRLEFTHANTPVGHITGTAHG